MAATLFGLSIPLAKELLTVISPQVLAGLFYLGSGIGLGSLRRIQSETIGKEATLSRSDLPSLAGAVIFGGIAAPVLLLTGLQWTPASATALLLNLEGVFTVILAWAIFHENLGRRVSAGIVAILLGGSLISAADCNRRGIGAIGHWRGMYVLGNRQQFDTENIC
jgi:drug/metabolite transporter (DMT)-like permease